MFFTYIEFENILIAIGSRLYGLDLNERIAKIAQL